MSHVKLSLHWSFSTSLNFDVIYIDGISMFNERQEQNQDLEEKNAHNR